jgi:anti-sigma factor RsiW
MDCSTVHEQLAGMKASIEPSLEDAVLEHLRSCESCRDHQVIEKELDSLLSQRLPRFEAPPHLKQRLLASYGQPPIAPRHRPRSPRLGKAWVVPVLSAALSAAAVVAVLRIPSSRDRGEDTTLVSEAVNDHLRVVLSSHPVEIESGGIHQVKPWFSGRLDFAPRVAFSGDDEFPLIGGSVGYLLDRKAAVFVFKCRLHTVTLLVFPHERLPWPNSRPVRLGTTDVVEQEWRGFNLFLWRRADLGFALVSDVGRADLAKLASRLIAP